LIRPEAEVELRTAVGNLADMLWVYMEAFIEAGFSREEALLFVRDFARTLKPPPQVQGDEWKG
jgi:hypothetical protein